MGIRYVPLTNRQGHLVASLHMESRGGSCHDSVLIHVLISGPKYREFSGDILIEIQSGSEVLPGSDLTGLLVLVQRFQGPLAGKVAQGCCL